ncbi:hypothetical protein [Nocardioides sp.]|uniref:hypothetical protein n=1 Tax=Nocardioides sp. TaxID=35761 RepID=UPI002735F5A7|nr:hypothetical protein [Nocardioides sp.]MDP3890948.1 hypothetical protein [Nocardioides sp.]
MADRTPHPHDLAAGPRTDGVRVSRELEIPPERAAGLYPLYREVLGSLGSAAAARHLLTEEEFVDELADPRIDKWVATGEADGDFLGMSTLARDLQAVPWASPDFYIERYPEQAARGAIWYLGFTMTLPGAQGAGVFATMLSAMTEAAVAEQVIVAWDMCSANIAGGLNGAITTQLATSAGAISAQLDTQSYFSADFSGGS